MVACITLCNILADLDPYMLHSCGKSVDKPVYTGLAIAAQGPYLSVWPPLSGEPGIWQPPATCVMLTNSQGLYLDPAQPAGLTCKVDRGCLQI